MSWQPRSQLIYLALMLAFAIWCGVSLYRDVQRDSFVMALHSWMFIVLVMALATGSYSLRVIRWQFFLRRLGHVVPFHHVALTYIAGFAFTLSPGKIGEVVRARYLVDWGISLHEVAACVLIERIMDVLGMAMLTSLLLIALPGFAPAVGLAAAIVAFAVTTLALCPWSRIGESAVMSRRWPFGANRVARTAVGVLASAQKLTTARMLVPGFLLGVVAWTLEGLGLAVLGSVFSPGNLPSADAVGIYSLATLLGAMTFLPGGLGGTEVVMSTLLTTRGYALTDAFVMTLACRLATLWFAVGLGWGATAVFHVRGRYRVSAQLEVRDDG